MERKLYECNYCNHRWFSRRKPKVCPNTRCHNPVGKKPVLNKRYFEK